MKKPDAEQVYEYMTIKGMDSFDEAESFIDHYTMVGWVVTKAKTPMKCWKSAVRIWLRNNRKWSKPNEKSNGHKQSFADNVSGQAARARESLKATASGVCSNNIRPLRSIGGSFSE